MSKCPYCQHELPPIDMDMALEMLKANPEFMSKLGQAAAEQYIKDNLEEK